MLPNFPPAGEGASTRLLRDVGRVLPRSEQPVGNPVGVAVELGVGTLEGVAVGLGDAQFRGVEPFDGEGDLHCRRDHMLSTPAEHERLTSSARTLVPSWEPETAVQHGSAHFSIGRLAAVFALSPELEELQATVRKLAQEKVAPRAREIDRTAEYPQDLFELFRDTGLLGLVIPEEYGGSGAGILGLTLAMEEVAKYSNTAALMLLLTRLPTGPVLIAGSEAQKQHYVRGIATGEMRAGFGLSEPQAGSDVVGMRTKAVRDGGDWVLSGTKCWMSGVVQADWYCVFAKTGPADSRKHDDISCFIVDRTAPGVSVGRTDDKMGVRGVDTGELLLDEVRVPAENMVGELGGFRLAMLGLNSMRPIVAARRHRPRGGRADVRGGVREAAGRVRQDDRRHAGNPVEDRRARHRDRGRPPVDVPGGRDGRRRSVHA